MFFPDQIDSSVPINIMRLFNNSVRWLREGYYDIRINSLYVGDMKHFYTQFKPGRQEGNIVYTLPDTQADGIAYLRNDGFGNLDWQKPSTLARISVYLDSAITLNAAGYTTVVFNKELYDNHSEYDTTTGVFKAKEDGYYAVSYSGITAKVSWAAGDVFAFSLWVNGSNFRMGHRMDLGVASTSHMPTQGTTTLWLNKDDEIAIRAYTAKTVNLQAIDSSYNFLTIDKVDVGMSGGSAIWGYIEGDITNQTDLMARLNAKEPTIASGTTAQYWRGDKTWQTLSHDLLPKLSFDDSGHTGFQKELVYDDILGCYLIG